uniref:Hexosyltransferase n=1 Tax=Haptolina ericina TaxID=156174 RepID=A0A7S3EWY7_9EUKA
MALDGTPPVLSLGVIPSEKPKPFEWRVHAARRQSIRETWLGSVPGVMVARFVVERPPRMRQGRRQEERSDELQRESRVHGDVVELEPPNGSVCLHAELTLAWFSHALAVWPTSLYFGKTEDDIYIATTLLLWDLQRLSAPLLWLGLFQWSGNGDLDHPHTGCWGGAFEDDPLFSAKISSQLLSKERKCPEGAVPLTPAPSRELDIRSAALARAQLGGCDVAMRWLSQQPRRSAGRRAASCPNDYSAVHGLWLRRCLSTPVTLAHLTWTKVHSNAADDGWRPFASPSNLTLALDMNLGDKKIRRNTTGAWSRVHDAIQPTPSTTFPPLLYSFETTRRAGDARFATPLNLNDAALHYKTCRWGGCHPSRGEAWFEAPGWRASAPCPDRQTSRALISATLAATCGVSA